VARPDDPAKYRLNLTDGRNAALRLDCNRGRWTSAATTQTQGSITFTPLAMTRAACVTGSLDTRIARELGYVRTYMINDGRLILVTMANGGSQVWSRVTE
jgi:heat shock protein HslJ